MIKDLVLDGWSSIITGLGKIGKDKTEAITYTRDFFFPRELLDVVYSGDAIAARVVDILPHDMLRQGYEVTFRKKDNTPLDADEKKKMLDALQVWQKKISLHSHIQRHLKLARAYGGSILLLGVNDGLPLSEPLVPERVKSFDFVYPLDRFQVTPSSQLVDDPTSPHFGYPEYYTINVEGGTTGNSPISLQGQVIHCTRVFRTDGVVISDRERRRNDSWGISIIQRIWEPLKNFNVAMKGAGLLMQDFSLPVYKVGGLREIIAANKTDLILKKFQLIEQTKSMYNAIILEKELEDYERRTTQVTGLQELIDKFGVHLAAASGMPLTLLLGISPGGFGTGQAEGDNWDDVVKAEQDAKLRPLLEKIYTLALKTTDFYRFDGVWDISFNPLQQMTELEIAELRNKQAQTDSIYLSAGVLSPDEIATSRFGGDAYSIETLLDNETRDEDMYAEEGENLSEGGTGVIAPDGNIQQTALNGAQISSLKDIVIAVSLGDLPGESAIELILAGFPNLSREQVEAMVNPAEKLKDETPKNTETPNRQFATPVLQETRKNRSQPDIGTAEEKPSEVSSEE
jgi:phage-related protein (TIGR01555 family)